MKYLVANTIVYACLGDAFQQSFVVIGARGRHNYGEGGTDSEHQP